MEDSVTAWVLIESPPLTRGNVEVNRQSSPNLGQEKALVQDSRKIIFDRKKSSRLEPCLVRCDKKPVCSLGRQNLYGRCQTAQPRQMARQTFRGFPLVLVAANGRVFLRAKPAHTEKPANSTLTMLFRDTCCEAGILLQRQQTPGQAG